MAWVDATDLIVLGVIGRRRQPDRPSGSPTTPVEIASEGESDRWNAVELTIQQRTQSIIVRGRSGETWRDDGSDWLPLICDKLDAIAYPG